jgi:hypothetical protein
MRNRTMAMTTTVPLTLPPMMAALKTPSFGSLVDELGEPVDELFVSLG